MYRDDKTYDEIKQEIVDIYLDFDIKNFPIDEKEICRNMGVAFVPYSELGLSAQPLLIKHSVHGFFVNGTAENVPTIYYNDSFESEGSQRLTIFHELKHYVFEDKDDGDDDLADFFARYFMCPIPYLLLKKIDTPNDIVAYCGTSIAVARNVYTNLRNRKNKYDYHLFRYEVPLIEHLEPVLLEVYSKEKVGDELYVGK